MLCITPKNSAHKMGGAGKRDSRGMAIHAAAPRPLHLARARLNGVAHPLKKFYLEGRLGYSTTHHAPLLDKRRPPFTRRQPSTRNSMQLLNDTDPAGIANTILLAMGTLASCTVVVLQRRHPKSWKAWAWIAGLMLVLTINKQLDLQVQLTNWLRWLTRRDGWYENRRTLQAAATIGLAGLSVAGTFLTASRIRRCPASEIAAWAGLGIYCIFILLRVASLHHVDTLLHEEALNVRLFRLIEPLGPAIVLTAAIANASHHWRRPANPSRHHQHEQHSTVKAEQHLK